MTRTLNDESSRGSPLGSTPVLDTALYMRAQYSVLWIEKTL